MAEELTSAIYCSLKSLPSRNSQYAGDGSVGRQQVPYSTIVGNHGLFYNIAFGGGGLEHHNPRLQHMQHKFCREYQVVWGVGVKVRQ